MGKVSKDRELIERIRHQLAEGIQTPLGDLMRQAHQRLVTTLDTGLRDAGWDDVRSPHISVLATIHPDGSRLTAVTERGGRTKQSVGELAAYLVDRGYLEVMADPTDGRAKLHRPTQRAYALLATCEGVVEDHSRWLDHAVGTTAVEQMRRTLQVIIDAEDAPS